MKKLNLLKPELKVEFLNEGKGEKVTYLHINDELTRESLSADVAAGAQQLEELKKLVDKTKGELSRVVILRGNNEENLYLAATYLAAVCNEKVGLNGDFEEELFDEADDFFEAYEADEEETDAWYESPFKLPLIEFEELRMTGPRDSFSPFGSDFMSLGMQQSPNQKPYWMSCRKEPVAIVIRKEGSYCSSYASHLERFQNNRHIFLLILDEEKHSFFRHTEDNEDELEETSMNYWEQHMLQLLLETTADMAWVKKNEKELEKYRILQLENWVETMEAGDYRTHYRFAGQKEVCSDRKGVKVHSEGA